MQRLSWIVEQGQSEYCQLDVETLLERKNELDAEEAFGRCVRLAANAVT